MAMQWLEGELRKTGDKQDKINADLIAAMREHRGDDIPLPTTQPTETEKPEIQRFSQEQREALRKEGYVVYELTGQSIADLREQGKPFWSTWHKSHPEFEALTSRHSEVAINPKQLFLPDSNNKTLRQQQAMIGRFSFFFGSTISGVKAVLGEVPDYVELAFLSPEKQRLFGEKNGYNYTRTQTRVDSDVANVGYFDPGNGLNVDRWYADGCNDYVFAAPLVVPVQGTK